MITKDFFKHIHRGKSLLDNAENNPLDFNELVNVLEYVYFMTDQSVIFGDFRVAAENALELYESESQ